jgi:hypothetical protein
VEIADSYTLIPLDQPARLATLISDFVDGDAGARSREGSVDLGEEAAVRR